MYLVIAEGRCSNHLGRSACEKKGGTTMVRQNGSDLSKRLDRNMSASVGYQHKRPILVFHRGLWPRRQKHGGTSCAQTTRPDDRSFGVQARFGVFYGVHGGFWSDDPRRPSSRARFFSKSRNFLKTGRFFPKKYAGSKTQLFPHVTDLPKA